jgi:hypothetical protein
MEDLFRPSGVPDSLQRAAGYRDGLRSVAVGICANRSLVTGQAVAVAELGLPLSRDETTALSTR